MFKKSLLAALVLASTSAIASPVGLNFASVNTTVSTNVSVNGNNLHTAIGSYNLNNGGANLVGFCVDPFQWASYAVTTYDKSSLDAADFFAGNGATRFANAQKLFDNAYATLSGATQTAGFHLALWEIFYDDLSTTSGSILGSSTSNAGMLAAANTFLGALSGWNTTNAYDLTFYGSGQHQDFLVANPSAVPVPAALPLLASSLLGFVAMRRRKAKA
jgi:hypothetical protein